MAKLQSPQAPAQAPNPQDQLAQLYQSIKDKSMNSKLEKQFEQMINGVGDNIENSYEASTSLKSIVSKDRIATAFGVANAAAVTSVLPINLGSLGFGIAGVSKIVVGILGLKFIAKKGVLMHFMDGVLLSGISDAVGGFLTLSSLGIGKTTNGQTSNFVE